jgi:hypothetical protein
MAVRGGLALVLVLGLLAAANGAYQIYRKPAELVGLVRAAQPRSPGETWAAYGPSFRDHSTDILSPPFLAALVQVESGGDALARAGWRWRWSWNPFEIYAPASSAVGVLQLTDAAFAEAGQLCVHNHRVTRGGAWHDPNTCWFTGLYTRLLADHSIEMTAAWLHDHAERILAGAGPRRATAAEKQRLAAVIHLCGAQRGALYARQGFRAVPGERCGRHALAPYVARVSALTQVFTRLDGGPASAAAATLRAGAGAGLRGPVSPPAPAPPGRRGSGGGG